MPMLESVCRKLRLLVRLIDRNKKKPVYTNFEDIIGEGEYIDFPGLRGPDEFVLFRQKARSFLREHMDIAAVYKLRMNIQLTTDDLDALEETMKEIGSSDAIGGRRTRRTDWVCLPEPSSDSTGRPLPLLCRNSPPGAP